MKRKKKYRGIDKIKSRYGYLFVAPWAIGFILFFAVPIVQSMWYSFSEIRLTADGVKTIFVGLENYNEILMTDPYYVGNVLADITSMSYSLPIILILSLILALLLNQKFRGRLFFRALYFMPVIIASGVVLELMFQTTDTDTVVSGVSSTLTGSMFSIEDITALLDLPVEIAEYVQLIITNIFDLIWSCGIQTVLFIAGLQSIPGTLYEASRMEGASKWQEFWFITLPMLANIILLVVIYTIVDIFTNTGNKVVSKAFSMINSGVYDITSAMLWFYFLIVGVLMGLFLFLYNRLLLKRWR